MSDCLICNRVRLACEGNNPYFVAELARSILVIGDHQLHRGYSLLLLKEHVTELHELAPDAASEYFGELGRAGRAVASAFRPVKLNYACYGNTDPHVHWHIFPRYADDPDKHRHPWLHADRFRERLIGEDEARGLAAQLRARL